MSMANIQIFESVDYVQTYLFIRFNLLRKSLVYLILNFKI